MKGIKEIVINNEKIHLKKSFDGYRVVYPVQKEDGKINWFNALTGGSWWILIKTLIFVLLILFVSWSYYHDTKACSDLLENICDYQTNISIYCNKLNTFVTGDVSDLNLSWGGLNGIQEK